MTVHASSQDPTETQHIVARVLGVPDAFVTVETRRMGGGFGGKESQACTWAAMAALAARVTGRPCKVRLDRDDDFMLTGKRHDFRADWRVGFDDRRRRRRLRRHAQRALRLFGRSVAGRRRPRDVSRRQRLLAAARLDRLAPAEDQHGIQHRLPRVRRPAGHDRDRARDGRDRPRARPRSARRPQGKSSARRLRRTPYGQTVEDFETQRRIIDELEATSRYRERRAAIAAFNASSPHHQARHRADAGDVRHLVHPHSPQPGGSAGARLFRWLDPSQSRRHRDGAGAVHQGRPDRRRGVRRAASLRAHHGDQHLESPQRLAHRRLLGNRPERHGGQDRRRGDQGTHGRIRRAALGRRRRGGRVSRRARLCRQRLDELRRARQGMPPGAGPALRRRPLQDAGNPLGSRQGEGPALLLLRLWRGLLGGRRSTR